MDQRLNSMKTKNALRGISIAVALHLGVLAVSAQTNIYLYTGYETNITLPAGTYNITAYGAQGGSSDLTAVGLGAEMEGQFSFAGVTTLTLLVGGGGGNTGYGYLNWGAGGGGGSFVVNGSTPLVIAGGGGGTDEYDTGGAGLISTNGGNGHAPGGGGGGIGGNGGGGSTSGGGGGGGFNGNGGNGGGGVGGAYSFLNGGGGGGGSYGVGNGGYGGGGGGGGYAAGGGGGYSGGGGGGDYSGGGGGGGSFIASSAITNLAEVSGIASPDDSTGNGEIIIVLVSTPPAIGITTVSSLPVVVWPASATNCVLQMTTNLASGNWVTVSNGIPFCGLQITNAPADAASFRLH
jgi:hypothetical protein